MTNPKVTPQTVDAYKVKVVVNAYHDEDVYHLETYENFALVGIVRVEDFVLAGLEEEIGKVAQNLVLEMHRKGWPTSRIIGIAMNSGKPGDKIRVNLVPGVMPTRKTVKGQKAKGKRKF